MDAPPIGLTLTCLSVNQSVEGAQAPDVWSGWLRAFTSLIDANVSWLHLHRN
jgi:hypothetical protein